MIENAIALILAAGGKEKMKSSYPKVMMRVLSKPMLEWVMSTVEKSGIERTCVVAGSSDKVVQAYIGQRASIVVQHEQKGTAHAVMQAKEFLGVHQGCDVLVINGDAPFMDAETIHSALLQHRQFDSDMTVISTVVENPFGYSRIVRDGKKGLKNIVEERDADSSVKKLNEVASGAYWFKSSVLLEAIDNISVREDGTYSIIDVATALIKNGFKSGVYISLNTNIVLNANTRRDISALCEKARMDVIYSLLDAGVNIPCFDGIMIDPSVEIGTDTTILPNTIIFGNTKIGKDCVIGPNSYIEDSTVGDNSTLDNTKCRQSKVGPFATIGPFVQIRPNSVIGERVHLGNFVEVKNSVIDEGTKVSHLTYVGDSDVGKNVNFGCGTVTVNYNGKAKYRTTIGDNVFIGCNTNLIAPVKIGNNAYTAAGSTITDDVPPSALGIARPRQLNKEGWVSRFKSRD